MFIYISVNALNICTPISIIYNITLLPISLFILILLFILFVIRLVLFLYYLLVNHLLCTYCL